MDANEGDKVMDAKEGDSTVAEEGEKGAALRRAETIRVYAEKDVFALMADVKNTIDEMTGNDGAAKESSSSLSDTERRKLCRTRSHDALTSVPARKPLPIPKLEEKPSSSSLTSAATATPPPAPAEPAAAEMFLTSAVFKPS
jgi:cell division septation protein DedD